MFAAPLLAMLLLPQASAPAAGMRVPPCTPAQLSLGTDSLNGDFDGMSHSGTLLVVRNLGDQPCTVLPLPTLTFTNRQHRPLDIMRQVPPGLHPGPVQVPVVVAAGAELTARMRWVSSPVFDGPKGGTCLTPAYVALPLGDQRIQAAFPYRLCGPTGKPVLYETEPLHPDPVYTPPKP